MALNKKDNKINIKEAKKSPKGKTTTSNKPNRNSRSPGFVIAGAMF